MRSRTVRPANLATSQVRQYKTGGERTSVALEERTTRPSRSNSTPSLRAKSRWPQIKKLMHLRWMVNAGDSNSPSAFGPAPPLEAAQEPSLASGRLLAAGRKGPESNAAPLAVHGVQVLPSKSARIKSPAAGADLPFFTVAARSSRAADVVSGAAGPAGGSRWL